MNVEGGRVCEDKQDSEISGCGCRGIVALSLAWPHPQSLPSPLSPSLTRLPSPLPSPNKYWQGKIFPEQPPHTQNQYNFIPASSVPMPPYICVSFVVQNVHIHDPLSTSNKLHLAS